ncbi:MAG: hypothetical protein K8R74_14030 [Bacteroidales bacterium]|nr:hypothetical protein [Bacteroidales bacterium]
MNSKLIFLSSFVIFTIAAFGQNTSKQSVSSNTKHEIVLFDLNLEQNSKIEEAFVNVERNAKSLFLNVKGSLKKGRLKVQIYDPKGNKWKKELIVDSRYVDEVFKYTTDKKYIPVPDLILHSKQPTLVYVGRFGIAINRPKSGQWKVKIVPEKAIGNVQVSYYFSQ